jgi:hypothetical protein
LFNRLCAYAVLAPRVSMSANKIHFGGLNTNRRKNLQWILLEDFFHFIKASHKAWKKFEGIKQKKGSQYSKGSISQRYAQDYLPCSKRKKAILS